VIFAQPAASQEAIKDNKGMTALMWADKLHHTGIVNLLKQD
jgi:ankyrin repeat protein